MKTINLFRQALTFTAVSAMLVLVGCQKGSALTIAKAGYQQTVSSTVGNLASNVDRAITGNTKTNRGMVRADVTSGTTLLSSLLNGQTYYNGVQYQASQGTEASDCVSFLSSIPEDLKYLQVALANEERCLAQINQYGNALGTFAFRNMGYQSQNQWSYLMDWRNGNSLQTSGYSPYSVFGNFGANGYFP